MPVRFNQLQGVPRPRPLSTTLDRIALLRQSNVNFIPVGNGRSIRTTPLLEDASVNWRERYVEAALIGLTNPLCFSAQSLINDELADAKIVVENKQSNGTWKEHTDNPLSDWLPFPNKTMDIREFFRAYSTHFHTFGGVNAFMFQKGDILPNGKINLETNCFDIIFPSRIAEDAVNNPYGIDWYYQPMGYEEPFKINPKSLFQDVVYNPLAHNIGVSLPNGPLHNIFLIHNVYLSNLVRFFRQGAIPQYLLTRMVDIQKDMNSMSITDDQIEEAIQRVYATVGQNGERPNGWLGLRGDWKVNKIGSPLTELINPDLLQYIDAVVSSVYKVPSSIFWGGMKAGGQRASRQQDSIDFFNQKINPLLTRICERIGRFLVPLFIPRKKNDFRVWFDVSEMALAQYAVTKQYRMYERWYQMRVIPRGKFLQFVNEPTDDLTKEQFNEYFTGGQKSAGLSLGTGDQPVEGGAGGSGLL